MVEVDAKKRRRELGDNCCVIVKRVLQHKKSMKSLKKSEPSRKFFEYDFELMNKCFSGFG